MRKSLIAIPFLMLLLCGLAHATIVEQTIANESWGLYPPSTMSDYSQYMAAQSFVAPDAYLTEFTFLKLYRQGGGGGGHYYRMIVQKEEGGLAGETLYVGPEMYLGSLSTPFSLSLDPSSPIAMTMGDTYLVGLKPRSKASDGLLVMGSYSNPYADGQFAPTDPTRWPDPGYDFDSAFRAEFAPGLPAFALVGVAPLVGAAVRRLRRR